MMLIGLILIGLIIYLFLFKPKTDPVLKMNQNIDALEIAKIRLAKGEISLEDYEMLKKAIL